MSRFLIYLILMAAVVYATSMAGQSVQEARTARVQSEGNTQSDAIEGVETPGLTDKWGLPETPGLADTINPEAVTDTIGMTESADSLSHLAGDRQKISRINREKTDLNSAVEFSAKDSLLLKGQSDAYLYGESEVEYGEFKLNSSTIEMDLDSNTVSAYGRTDSIGNLEGNPIFTEKGTTYESKTMRYNFKTERGFITDILSEQGEGFLMAENTKKNADGSFYIENGRYTTCDDHDHPHFYFKITRGKMRPQKDVVTGPGYMVLADVPLPLALPFGFFPFSKDYSSGIIFPSFGEDYNRGFYMRDGGYYFAFSDYVDLALRGELYTRGSWGISARSSYVKRYRFRGSFDISYITTIYGDKGMPDYSKQNNFQVIWNHSLDPKANPNMSFSAAVNFTTSGYTRNDLNSYYSTAFTENTKSSTVNMTYRFPGTKWSLSTTASISQRTQDSTLSVSFPNITVNMSQTAPFKRKKSVGGERWYEKIKMSYNGQFQNSLTAQQNQFFNKSLIKDWRNGMKHYVPISATFSLLKYINVSPSVTLNDRMYTSRIEREWNPNASAEVCDTTYGFYNLFDFNASISLDTKLYGFYKPMKFLGDKVQMIRHVLTPTISFSGAPDFSAPGWGIYGRYKYTDTQGVERERVYSRFSHGIFGSPSAGTSAVLSVNLANNLEMKVKSDKDTTGVKKISLIENLQIGQSYNFAADSMNWSNVSASIMLRLVKNFNLNVNSTWDPYTYQLTESGSPVHVNVPRWKAHKGWVRLASAGTSFSYTFNNQTFKKKAKENSDDTDGTTEEDAFNGDANTDAIIRRREEQRRKAQDEMEAADVDGYAKWECPWSLTVNYSVNYGYGAFNRDKMEYDGKFTQNLSFSGNIRPTKNWNFSLSASYDFTNHKIAYMNCSITRDLHCFTMMASFVPVGPYKSYNFTIAVKSSLLKDLKYDKRSSNSNGIDWY